jgi:uncharacterized protein (TIGR03086 family)
MSDPSSGFRNLLRRLSIPGAVARHHGAGDGRRLKRSELTMKYFILLAGYGEMPTWDELTPEQQQADMAKFGVHVPWRHVPQRRIRSAGGPNPWEGRTSEGLGYDRGMSVAADRYRQLSERFTVLVDTVPHDRWDAQSPCVDWKAIDIVAHVADTEIDFVRRMPFADVLPAELPSPAVERWKIVRSVVQSALDDSDRAEHGYDGFFGPTTFSATIDQFYSMDLCVHAWDVARATGLSQFEPIDRNEMGTIRAAMSGLGDNLRQPGLIDAEIVVADSADEQTKFLAWLGRRG